MLISIFVYFWLYLVYFRWGSRLICELFEGFASLPGSAACLRIWVQILPGLEAKDIRGWRELMLMLESFYNNNNVINAGVSLPILDSWHIFLAH